MPWHAKNKKRIQRNVSSNPGDQKDFPEEMTPKRQSERRVKDDQDKKGKKSVLYGRNHSAKKLEECEKFQN